MEIVPAFHPLASFRSFYLKAVTRYQLHSPFLFELANGVVEDRRWYYAFDAVEALRRQMRRSDVVLEFEDFGRGGAPDGPARPAAVRQLARRSASSPAQGRMLFRLALWSGARRILELGTSLGVSTAYLASADRRAQIITLEGSAACARVARAHFEMLQLPNIEVIAGKFDDTLPGALERLGEVDLVFFDGDHRGNATLRYLEACLPYAHDRTVLVFDDMYAAPDMTEAWYKIQQHPRVRCTVDLFDLSLAFLNPDFREKQHVRLVPVCWKPWLKFKL